MYHEHLTTVMRRFDEALETHGFESVLIYSGQAAIAFLDDNAYPYRVNPFFKYWVPVTESPKSFIFYQKGERPQVYLFQERDFWHTQPQIPAGSWQELVELSLVDNIDLVRERLAKSLNGKTAYIGEEFAKADWFVDNLTERKMSQVNPAAFIDHLHYQRTIKTAYEVDCLKAANLIAARGHNAAYAAFLNQASELEIHHAYLAAIQCHETQLPYKSIVGLNQNGAVLHYDKYDIAAPAQHKSFLIDAGALYQGYCADITRTYSFQSDGFYAELVDAMDQAERDIISEIEVGRSYYDLHVAMHLKVAELLKRFGFIQLSTQAMYEKGYTSAFFPHGLGHYIGLQVHDVGGYLKNAQGDLYERDSRHPFLRLQRPIEAGQVFTIEPGLYVIDQLLEAFAGNPDFNWQRIDELRPYGGVRIEDSVHVTATGTENLSRQAFKQLG